MKKTVIEWLVEQLRMPTSLYTKEQIIEQAKEMELQQIINAYIDGINSDCMSHEDSVGYANKYYNEKFSN